MYLPSKQFKTSSVTVASNFLLRLTDEQLDRQTDRQMDGLTDHDLLTVRQKHYSSQFMRNLELIGSQLMRALSLSAWILLILCVVSYQIYVWNNTQVVQGWDGADLIESILTGILLVVFWSLSLPDIRSPWGQLLLSYLIGNSSLFL